MNKITLKMCRYGQVSLTPDPYFISEYREELINVNKER